MSSIELTGSALLALAPQDALQGSGVKELVLSPTAQGLEVSCHWQGLKVKSTLVLAAVDGQVPINATNCKVDGIPAPSAFIEERVAPHVTLPYHDGVFWLALPGWNVSYADCDKQGVLIKLQR